MVKTVLLIADLLIILLNGSDFCQGLHKIFQLDKAICKTVRKISHRQQTGSGRGLMKNITEYNNMVIDQIERFKENKPTCIPFIHDFFQNHGPSFRKICVHDRLYKSVLNWGRVQLAQYYKLTDKTDKLWYFFKTLYFKKVIDKLDL